MRKKPYTTIGISRLKCFRCKAKARYQWQICSDGNIWRPVCTECDIKLNRLVLMFMGDKDWEAKIRAYELAKNTEQMD